MRSSCRYSLAMMVCGFAFLRVAAQCPVRPTSGTVVQDALNLYSQNGVLSAGLYMRHSVDKAGYTHFCYNYKTSSGDVESPTLRLNQGDVLKLGVVDAIDLTSSNKSHKMAMPASGSACGDSGNPTIASNNVHFHGLNVSPHCHSDDVLTTLIQANTPGFEYDIQIPSDEPPGLYWYHPHVHGFTEFQVNGGAPGALIVEGMEKVRPEVAGLTERVFVVRQQYLVPWVPGPYQLTLNYQVAVPYAIPIVQMKPGEKQFWRVANATLQDFMPLQFQVNGGAEQLQLIALDGYPLPAPRNVTTILVPPAGRAEFIVTAPAAGQQGTFVTKAYSTGPTGNPDLPITLATIQITGDVTQAQKPKSTEAGPQISMDHLKFAGLSNQAPTAQRKIYFSEEFGGTNGPIQFYITVDGQKQKVFEADEKPAIITKVGAVEDWTIENHALETHDFHIHQIHFMMLEVDGKPVTQDMRDTIEIPYWDGVHAYHSVKVRMDFRDPTIAGTFVFHCHILLHEDLGMMHKILVEP
jgi:FtsP/CotA-like multicopper oxidase with cupredoxin domain